MSSDAKAKIFVEIENPSRVWAERIASACFAEELDLESLPLSENVKSDVRSILEELYRLSPLEALSRCISIHNESRSGAA